MYFVKIVKQRVLPFLNLMYLLHFGIIWETTHRLDVVYEWYFLYLTDRKSVYLLSEAQLARAAMRWAPEHKSNVDLEPATGARYVTGVLLYRGCVLLCRVWYATVESVCATL